MKLTSPYRVPSRPSSRPVSTRPTVSGPARGAFAFGAVGVLCLVCAAVVDGPSAALLVLFAGISATLSASYVVRLRQARRLLDGLPAHSRPAPAEHGSVWEGWRVGSGLGL